VVRHLLRLRRTGRDRLTRRRAGCVCALHKLCSVISVETAVDDLIGYLDEEREPDGRWHPSSVWRCARRAVYEVRGTTHSNPWSAATRRRFRIGHMLHGFVAEALTQSGEVVSAYPEFEVRHNNEIGHGDVLLELMADEWAVVEVKSSKERHPKLDPGHAAQAQTYAVHARTRGVWTSGGEHIEPLGDKLTGALVVYVGKQAMDLTEYWLPYDVSWETRLASRIAALEEYRADPGSLPPRLASARSVKSPACYPCPFLDRCWQQDGVGRAPAAAVSVRAVSEQVEAA
jgi:hypothetical protein